MEALTPQEIFLRGVWKMIPDEDDISWVRRFAEEAASDEPLGDTGPIVRAMLNAGISEKQIARFARIVGYETAFQVLYHLGDSRASYEDSAPQHDRYLWQLFLVRPVSYEPYESLTGLHSMILMEDPSGREMRPKKMSEPDGAGNGGSAPAITQPNGPAAPGL